MLKGRVFAAAALFAVGIAVSSCGNTIQGMGKDTASAIDATQDAGRSIDNAAK